MSPPHANGVCSEPGILSYANSTPIKKHLTSTSRYGTSPFTSSSAANAVKDHRVFMEAADEMTGLWFNVRPDDIINMLPETKGMPEVHSSKFNLDEVTEEKMYQHVHDACRPFHKSSFQTWDTHQYYDPNSGFFLSRQVSPDALTFSDHHGFPDVEHPCDVSKAELFWEMKARHTLDGFNPQGTLPFERASEDGKRTRGQLTMYANALQGSQYRTHVFGIFVVLKQRQAYCRLIYHTRSGAFVSHDKPAQEILPQFLWRFSHATPAQRGHDDTVISLKSTNDSLPGIAGGPTSQDIKSAMTALDLKPEDPLYLIPVSTRQEDGDVVTNRYIVSKSFVGAHLSPVGRGTACFVAWNYARQSKVLLKEQWRIRAYHQEGEIYKKLAVANVSNVPGVQAYGDVLDHCCGQHISERRLPPKDDNSNEELSESPFRVLVHSRIVLDIVGQPLRYFESTWELVNAMLHVLTAHQEAYEAGILHRDMSEGNWILGNGSSGRRKGVLIDWELAKFRDEQRARSSARTGTWQFLSIRLLTDQKATHELSDDLESAIWVLFWTLIKFANNELSPKQRAKLLQRFEYHELGPEEGKLDFVFSRRAASKRLGLTIRNSPKALITLVDKLGQALGDKYDIDEPNDNDNPADKRLFSHDWLISTITEALENAEWQQRNDPARKNPVTDYLKAQSVEEQSSKKRKFQSMQDRMSPELKKRARLFEAQEVVADEPYSD